MEDPSDQASSSSSPVDTPVSPSSPSSPSSAQRQATTAPLSSTGKKVSFSGNQLTSGVVVVDSSHVDDISSAAQSATSAGTPPAGPTTTAAAATIPAAIVTPTTTSSTTTTTTTTATSAITPATTVNKEILKSRSASLSKTNAVNQRSEYSLGGEQELETQEVDGSAPSMHQSYTLYVSKLDAGVAILLTNDHYLIEFPALLLPESTTAGSIVNIHVQRNRSMEDLRRDRFFALQRHILQEFSSSPLPPSISIRKITQTSIVLQLEPLLMNNATLKRIDVYRNGTRVTGGSVVVRPTEERIKLSGLDPSGEYSLWVVAVTSAGHLESNHVEFQTKAFDGFDGLEADPEKKRSLLFMEKLVGQLGATWTDTVTFENTHLICHPEEITSSHPSPVANKAEKSKYDQAVHLNIPIVSPDWLRACYAEGRVKPATEFHVRKNTAGSPVESQA